MKRVAVFILGLPLAFATAALDLSSLETCVREVRADSEFYRRWIPPALYSMDRRLYQMTFGIPVHEENLALLQRKAEAAEIAEPEIHLAANATDGCHAFRDQYRRRIRQFLSLGGCVFLLLGLLTLRAFSTIFAPEKRKLDVPPIPSSGSDDSPRDTPENTAL